MIYAVRAVIGFLLCPAIGVGMFSLGWTFDTGGSSVALPISLGTFFNHFQSYMLFGYLFALVIAVPLLLIYRAIRTPGPIATCLIALLAGSVGIFWLLGFGFILSGAALTIGCLGGGYLFWFVSESPKVPWGGPRNRSREIVYILGLLLVLIVLFNVVADRDIPDQLEARHFEERYGFVLDAYTRSALNPSEEARLAAYERLRPNLEADPSILGLDIDTNGSSFRYRRQGEKRHGCIGDLNPSHRLIMACRAGGRFMGTTSFSYRRDPTEGELWVAPRLLVTNDFARLD